MPPKVEIKRVVAWNVQAGKLIHVPEREVLFEALGKINRGPSIELVTRALAAGIIGNRIQAVAVLANVHLQIAVRPGEPPFRKHFPLRERFDAVGAPAHLVAGDEWENDIIGKGASFDKRSAGFRGAKV